MDKYMKVAYDTAASGVLNNCGGPFGAVVVKDGVIVGKGCNSVLKNNDPTAHGEVMAIRDACKNLSTYDLSGCSIYTTSYPCPMCLSAIIWANIDKIYYGSTKEDAANIGFRDDYIYKVINNMNQTDFLVKEIDRDETIKLLEDYSKNNKTIY